MKYLLVKDKKYRQLYKKFEIKKKCLKFLLINTNFNNLQHIYFTSKIKNYKKSTLTKIKNRCSLTNRGRGNLSKFQLSRIKLRNLLSLGLIPGYKKIIW